jgi:hypothetical protein
MKIDVLPESTDVVPVETKTRAAYLWQFFRARKAAHDEPFFIELEDPETGTRQTYLASFSDQRLSYAVLCAKVYSTGLALRERRVIGGPA